jgi:hypothetical protein
VKGENLTPRRRGAEEGFHKYKKISAPPRLCVGFAALFAVVGCTKSSPPAPHQPRAVASEPVSETPNADKVIAEAKDDPAWLAGTWKKDGENRWLLFNLPAEVAELAGRPARVVRRGKLVIHGRYLSAIFDGGELNLDGTQDHSELVVAGGGGVYRRGAPP